MTVRHRYLAFKIWSEDKISRELVIHAIWQSVVRFFGEFQASKFNLWVMTYNEAEGKGIVRCSLETVDLLRASLATITEINGRRTSFQIMGISGTVKAGTKKFLGKHEKVFTIPKIAQKLELIGISGDVARVTPTGEIDILPDTKSKKLIEETNTNFIGLTIFDLQVLKK